MTQVNAETINSLGSKLDAFASELSEEERTALGGVLSRAEQASEAEVGGFEFQRQAMNFGQVQVAKFDRGVSSQLANSLGGPGDLAAIGVTVVWGW